MNQGEIYWVAFPPSEGREQMGQRPGLIVQGGILLQSLPTIQILEQCHGRVRGAPALCVGDAVGLSRVFWRIVWRGTSCAPGFRVVPLWWQSAQAHVPQGPWHL
jgi:hypothetical protein